ncbi:MAG: beta-ketoacyl synthase chain length factor [Planctomycetes bacterium]|nr:beta-ketoacyl synthase chain length factor [Planctomycetota bacterium]
MIGPRVAITGVGLWMPGYPTAGAWAERTPLPEDEPRKPGGLAYDRVNRRRASQMGRAIGDAVAEAMAQAGVEPRTTPVIVGSSIGEASAMIGLLDQMWRAKEPMSPAVFTVSVHNAASGLLSISMKNKGYTTSIAADYDTPAAALLEGIGLLATDHEAVCCVCADEQSPRSLLEHAPHWDMLAGAVVLTRAGAGRAQAHLQVGTDGTADVAAADAPEPFTHNPQVGMLDLIDALQRGDAGHLRLDRGKGRGYLAHLQP